MSAVIAVNPDVVVMIGPYKPIAAFVKEARAAGLTVPLATISFVGTENLIAELAADAEGLVISQVMPSPTDERVPVVKAYRAALAQVAADAKPSYPSLEGYVSGRVLLLGLERAGKDLTRDGLVTALDGLTDVDLGGLAVTFTPQRRQALNQVWLTRVKDGVAIPTSTVK